MLLSAGSRFILLDDDLRLPLRRPDFARGGFQADPDGSPQARFHADMEHALGDDSGSAIEEDPFDLHLEICGQPLGACIGGRYGFDRTGLRGLSLGRLESLKPVARIVTTHHGSYGSSRSESSLWLFHTLDTVGQAEFWRDRESYERNIGAHFVLYASRQARALEMNGFTPFAFDNSRLLPCTNPVGRAEDSLGSALTRFCHPDSLAFELPVAIGHVQESLRPRPSRSEGESRPRVNEFLRDFVRLHGGLTKAEAPDQRLGFLAHVMRDLSRASVHERVEQLREYRASVHAEVIARLQHQLDSAAEAPEYWQADVRAIIEARSRQLLASGAAPGLAEWPSNIDLPGCAEALSGELDAMAGAFEHWPRIWQQARESGEDLASPP